MPGDAWAHRALPAQLRQPNRNHHTVMDQTYEINVLLKMLVVRYLSEKHCSISLGINRF